MISVQKMLMVVIGFNVILLVLFYGQVFSNADLKTFQTEGNQNLFAQEEAPKKKLRSQEVDKTLIESQDRLDQINDVLRKVQTELEATQNLRAETLHDLNRAPISPKTLFKPLAKPDTSFATYAREDNPFYILGAYEEAVIQVPYENRTEDPKYHKVLYGYHNDDDYCERVDYYNLAHPENIFEKKVFFTDYTRGTVPRNDIFPNIGKNVIPDFNKRKGHGTEKRRLYHFDLDINTFFINMDGFQVYHEIGKHWLCATQMFNHIPGQRALIRKDDLVEAIDRYAAKFNHKSACFNKQMFFPFSYRLFLDRECKEFFEVVNSPAYTDKLETDPIQYIFKISHGSHSANGVFLGTASKVAEISEQYENGEKCGKIDDPNIAQVYVSDPLLLDKNNKFDFRVYMLVASTDPLVVYYHDGFLRATLSSYDKFSEDKDKHLTNTHLAEAIFKNAPNEQELRDYHIWSFEELMEYLYVDAKVVTDPNWLDNHLRPQFKKAMIHIVKMTSEFFFKRNNIYGLYGLDFMLDKDFNLWFIEGNPNPQLVATSQFLGDLLNKMLLSLFEIEYNLYKSRMVRVLDIIERMQKDHATWKRRHPDPEDSDDETAKGPVFDYSEYQKEYKLASKNRFEKEFTIGKNNSFTLIMDEYIEGPGAYFGNIPDECASP